MQNILASQLQKWTITVQKESVTDKMMEKLGKFSSIAQDSEKKVDAYTFTYKVSDYAVAGFLVAPKEINSKLPVIIYNRGGTADYGLIPKGRLFTRLSRLAEWGFIVIGTQYPGNALSEGIDERGGATDIESVLKLYDLIESLENADHNNIGMFGDSRGGMMTYLCLKQVNWVKSALTIGGLTDLDSSLRYRPEMKDVYERHFKNTPATREARSVIHWVDKLNKSTPICILHGTADDKVHVNDALDFALKLQEFKHPYSLHIFKDGDHGLMNASKNRDIIMKDWFERCLKEN